MVLQTNLFSINTHSFFQYSLLFFTFFALVDVDWPTIKPSTFSKNTTSYNPQVLLATKQKNHHFLTTIVPNSIPWQPSCKVDWLRAESILTSFVQKWLTSFVEKPHPLDWLRGKLIDWLRGEPPPPYLKNTPCPLTWSSNPSPPSSVIILDLFAANLVWSSKLSYYILYYYYFLFFSGFFLEVCKSKHLYTTSNRVCTSK